MGTMKNVLLTKELVDELLSINNGNRRISSISVDAYVDSLKAGSFFTNNGQVIKVNKSHTRLLDGQHRLMALMNAGYPECRIWLYEEDDDIAEKTFATTDICAQTRSTSQMVGVAYGIQNATRVTGICSTFKKCTMKRFKLNPEEVSSWYEKNSDLLDRIHYSSQLSISSRRPKCGFIAGVLNAYVIARNDEIINSWERVLFNKCETSAENLLLSFIVKCDRKQVNLLEAFYKTTKALLNPSIGVLKYNIDENTDYLNSYIVTNGEHPLFK